MDAAMHAAQSAAKSGKMLVLRLKFVSGVRLHRIEARDLYCNVEVESSITKLSCVSVAANGSLQFEEMSVKLCNINDAYEDVDCVITLVIEEIAYPVGTFSLADLLIAEDAVFEHFFQLPSQQNRCKISMVASLE